jgi:hypothetical protein
MFLNDEVMKKGRLHENYIPYSRPFILFLSYYLFSFKV